MKKREPDLYSLQTSVLNLIEKRDRQIALNKPLNRLKAATKKVAARLRLKGYSKRHIPEIDELYVYKSGLSVPFTHWHQKGEYDYMKKGSKLRSKDGEIHIYHQTAIIADKNNGLTLVTKNDKIDDVELFFEESISTITKDVKKINTFKKAKITPKRVGLPHVY